MRVAAGTMAVAYKSTHGRTQPGNGSEAARDLTLSRPQMIKMARHCRRYENWLWAFAWTFPALAAVADVPYRTLALLTRRSNCRRPRSIMPA